MARFFLLFRSLGQREPIPAAVLGALNVARGLALLFAPQWFFENIGAYPPFNRHYEGDLGAIPVGLQTLLLGLALLLASPNTPLPIEGGGRG